MNRVLRVDTEGIAIRKAMGEILGNAGAEFAGLGEGRIGLEGDEIESAEAHADVDGVAAGANASDDFAEDAGAIFERAAIFSGAGEGAEEFVEEVAVAMFDIDEICANVRGDRGRFNIAADEFLNISVGEEC